MHLGLCVLVTGLSLFGVQAVNFPFESIQLSDEDVEDFPSAAFGDRGARPPWSVPRAECKAFPGSEDWPSEEDWARLNRTIDGALLKPSPPAVVCYPGPRYNEERCRYLLRAAVATHFYLDDPLTTLTSWTEGNSCLATLNPVGNCTQGGFPVYVVNATTVKHIQAAVNFARNRNIRLVIKNTGHDFGGRSTGAGSLSVWVHNLKSFELLPEYTIGEYSGMAVKIGAGIEAWEMFNHMGDHNISVVAPGGTTVGMMGGWMGFGGHSTVVSTFGLASDQALSIEVVTADGRLVTADPFTNTDLFYALRGGGAGTYGIMTSAIMKAYPPINTTGSSLSLATGPRYSVNFTAPAFPPPNNTNATNTTWPRSRRPGMAGVVTDTETFWQAISMYYRYGQKVVDAGGMVFGYIYPQGNDSFSFSSSQTFPGLTPAEGHALMQPLYDALNAMGVNATLPLPRAAGRYGSGHRGGGGDGPVQTRYRSRLFPRRNWDDDVLWNATMRAVRKSIERAGPEYTFHGIMHSPTYEVAGWPGADSAVNPAWREGIMHASLMEKQAVGMSAAEAMDKDERVEQLLDLWREVTPGSGAYLNEGDPAEPDWQQSFFGDLYPKLLRIKQKRDPWGLFWAPTTVGSEGWEVRTEGEYRYSQNGRLCRVDEDEEEEDKDAKI